uniref:KIAA1549 like n=1 Tax=Catagonus wagneri TaxID=51154 RepID=A0A8C3YW50_9CETA
MARQEAKPQGPREAGPAARGCRGPLRAGGLGRAGWGAARCSGVRCPPAAASQDAPPLPPLLLGLLLLAALLEHCLADPGTDSLQLTVTPTPESFPRGKLLPISPTWPFSEVQAPSAADRTKAGLGPSPDNTSWPQAARTPPPKTHRRARAHGAFPSSPYQGGGRGASLEPSQDSAGSLVQPRPQGGREAAALSGLPPTSMLPPLSGVPPATSLSTVLPSRPPRVGTPSVPKRHSPRADAFAPSSSSSLAPGSPHSITFSQPARPPTAVPLLPQTAPTDPSASRSLASPLHPLAEEMNRSSKNAQDLVSTLRLGPSGSSAPAEGPRPAGSPTPAALSSVADLAPLSPPPLAPGSFLQLPGGAPSSAMVEVALSPAATQLSEAEAPEEAHKAVSLPAFRSTATHRAASSLVQAAESAVVEVTSRKSVPATASDSFRPLRLSAAPENSRGPPLSAEHTSSPLVPSPLPLATAGPGQEILSGAVPASRSNGAAADFSSTPASLRSPAPMPAPQKAGPDGAPPVAATGFLPSSKFPNLPSTTGTFPPQEDSVTAVLKNSKKADLTVALQTLPRNESPGLPSESGFTYNLSTDHVSTDITMPRTSLLPSKLPPPPLPFAPAAQTASPSLSFSSPKPETYTAVMDRSQSALSASKQVTAFSSSSEVYDFSTMGDTKKPAIADVFWSSLSAEASSLSAELTMSGLLQQTNYDVHGHTINSTSWGTHSASITPPSSLNSSINTIKSQDFKGNIGHSVTAGGLSFQDPDLGTGTSRPIQQSDTSMVGNPTDFLSVSAHSHSRDFQTAGVEDSGSHPHLQLPAHPAHPLLLTSPSLETASWQEMLSDGMDPGSHISGDTSPSLDINASTPFQNTPRYHSTAVSPPLSSSALFRTPSKAVPASQRPEKWTVDSSVLPKAEPTTAAATTLFLRKSSPPVLSAALVAKGTGSSPSAVASGLVKSSWTTTLARNVTSNAAPGPKATPGAAHPAFSFTPTYMFARTAHAVSTHTAMQGDTGAASGLLSTTHLPRKPQAMHTGFPNPTNPDTPRVSTARPLTITAALTSITAPVRATRMPPLSAENTDAALPAASTAMVTTGKMTSNLECQMSSKLLVKTVLFLTQRRMQISETLKLTVAKGLTQALRKAFHQNDVSAHVDILEHSHNVTVGYYATKGRLVYLPAVVVETLGVYGVSNVTADLKQHTPSLQSVAVLATPWNPQPAGYFQLKTVLQFVSQSDNIQSCKFAQTMEQRLQRAFQDAERKVLNTKSNLTIQMLSTSNASQTVTLVYVVGNRSSSLNGTVASSLLRQLSAELVGFYLTYPPLTVAEPLEYPNLDISETTRDYWVITVLQGVDNSLMGLHNQSFARLMEQRLAQLFMMSQQQGRRFKRATTLGSYTVQMVKMQRVPGPKDPAELTYYTLYNGKPLLGTAAAKILSTIDSQRMALTLHHVVLLQADPVVKNPPNNLWIIAAVLAPIAVVTVIIIIITAVLCRKNKNDFKPDTMMNLPQRAKPVQGFDYAKQHLGQQGADEEVIAVTQETAVLPLPVRDAPAPQERDAPPDGSTIKTAKSMETRKSRSPSENGSVISNESGKPSSGRRSPQNVMAQQKVTKEEARKRNVPASDEEEGAVLFDSSGKAAADPFDTSSGSVQLIGIKPTALPVVHPTSDRSQEPAALNGEVNKALKQKSDIEHYRNKLRLKAKRKGYYDFPAGEASKAQTERKKMYEKAPKEIEHVLDPDPELCAPFAEAKSRQQMKNSVYRSRQSLNSPSPGETEMDLLVTRERPRRGIRNSGYDTEPEIIEETNIDRVNEPRGYARSRHVKGHSETSTLSSQPSIDEVRQQMHMLLEEAFSLASAGHAGQSRHQEAYGSAQHLPYSEVVTSAPGTMTRPRAGVQWVPTYRPEMYQYSLPRPAYRFSQLPEMVMGSPPPPVPPRTGPVAVASLRRSTSDIGSKTRMAESSGPEPAQLHDSASFTQVSRGPVSVAQLDQSALNYSGNTVPAVFAIPAANRPGFTGYFIPTPPSSYRNQAWMSYAGENELPSQWADSVPLPGYIEAYPRSRYQQNSPSRLPRQYSQPAGLHPSLEQAPGPSTAASQQSLAENDPPDTPLTNISTAALVKAIREEVAKLAKKQTDMFEFQV